MDRQLKSVRVSTALVFVLVVMASLVSLLVSSAAFTAEIWPNWAFA